MRECECDAPNPYQTPAKAHACIKCGFLISPRWSCNDSTLRSFMDGMAAALPTRGDAYARFRIDIEAREFAGRRKFGQSFHKRNNISEAMEEACDGALYACLDTLAAKRRGDDEHTDLALDVALHFYRAYEALIRLHHKRGGNP